MRRHHAFFPILIVNVVLACLAAVGLWTVSTPALGLSTVTTRSSPIWDSASALPRFGQVPARVLSNYKKAAVYAATYNQQLFIAWVNAYERQEFVDYVTAVEAAQNSSLANSSDSSTYHRSYNRSSGSGGSGANADWAAIRQCESGGDYSEVDNGYYGAYQFSDSTWHSLGYTGHASDAPPVVQDQAAQQLAARDGMGQWPVCGSR